MRVVLIVVGVVLAGLIGLYLFGLSIEPEVQTIEQEVAGGADA